MDWARILAFVTGSVDQELLARNECLAAGTAQNVVRLAPPRTAHCAATIKVRCVRRSW